MRIVVVLRRTSGGAACGRWIDRFRARSMYVSINHHPWIGELMPATSGGPICIQRYSVEYPKFVPKKFVYTVCTSTCILEKAKKKARNYRIKNSGYSCYSLSQPTAQQGPATPNRRTTSASARRHLVLRRCWSGWQGCVGARQRRGGWRTDVRMSATGTGRTAAQGV
jgi:hypothetical protein